MSAGPESAEAVSAATLTVSRRAAGDMEQREVFASLNGKEFAILQYGDSVTREVPAGRHRLRIHNTMFWKTIEFELAPGDIAEFSARSRAGWGTYGIAVILGAGPLYLDVFKVR